MHYASVENISKSFGIRTLFKNISFHVEEGDKIAFVARNGSGKSTLLKILAGQDTADTGTVWVHKDIKVVMLHQEHAFDEEKTIWDNVLRLDNPVVKVVKEYEMYLEEAHGHTSEEKLNQMINKLDELNAWNFEGMLKTILGKLNIDHLNEPVKNLSGGQKKRVALAQALLESQLFEGRCLLILDEPTNHLDVEMIEWLEKFLSAQRITLLLVTHDRYFLDAVCNEIIEMENEVLYVYNGKYDYFLEQKAARHEVQQSELQKDKNIFRKELEWMRKQPKARTTKSKSRQDAFVEIEDRVKQQRADTDVSIQSKMTRLGGKVVEMKKVNKSYGDNLIIKSFDHTFKKGEKVGIVGKNGVGKSTFLRLALKTETPDSGKVNHGETVVFGNFAQEGLVYKEDKRAIEYVKELAEFFPLADGSKISASQFMEKFGFPPEQQFTPLSKLSGGEKRRLHLLSTLFPNPNFLVLDEPTNDLDLQTLSTLEEFLKDFPGCLIIVSHDRYFMDRVVDHLFAFEGEGVIKDYPGNYSQYREWREVVDKEARVAEAAASRAAPVVAVVKSQPAKKVSFKDKHEFETLQKDIPALEAEKKSIEENMNSGAIAYNELRAASERIEIIIKLLDEKESRWLELSEKME